MPNTYFQFKQFRIEQGQTAMKVTTEGCLLGALVSLEGSEQQILDIGTGTGLLALMIAQRSEAKIDAVELSSDAANQSTGNFDNSPWSERLSVWNGAIQEFASVADQKYDLIVSNPPFFKGHLKSGKAKDQAIHSDDLSLEDLCQSVINLLKQKGLLWVIYPSYEFDQMVEVAKSQGLLLQKQFEIYDRPEKSIFRKVGVFGCYKQDEPESEVIFIKEENGTYSDRFQGLVAPYYL
ncbi:MAG: methyltransferase [Cytophagales bacterium]|nr:methyltransferase [Cytophagales bacterium]